MDSVSLLPGCGLGAVMCIVGVGIFIEILNDHEASEGAMVQHFILTAPILGVGGTLCVSVPGRKWIIVAIAKRVL